MGAHPWYIPGGMGYIYIRGGVRYILAVIVMISTTTRLVWAVSNAELTHSLLRYATWGWEVGGRGRGGGGRVRGEGGGMVQ